jgi:hypothetical protein
MRTELAARLREHVAFRRAILDESTIDESRSIETVSQAAVIRACDVTFCPIAGDAIASAAVAATPAAKFNFNLFISPPVITGPTDNPSRLEGSWDAREGADDVPAFTLNREPFAQP